MQFFIRVLLASWLPVSYHFNQCTILALGFWAIVYRDNVVQVELVRDKHFFVYLTDCVSIMFLLSVDVDRISIDYHGFSSDWHVFSNRKEK
jgi:hypothetical protein